LTGLWKSYGSEMSKGRLEAFSDGVIAILITIMVLELKVPLKADWSALVPLIPVFLSYVMSFAYLAIYWNNHHHLLQAIKHVDGRVRPDPLPCMGPCFCWLPWLTTS
jgi:uncharacterized membrane protein